MRPRRCNDRSRLRGDDTAKRATCRTYPLSPSAARPKRSRKARAFAPKFDADGLVTCVATDARSGDVLMVAHMNAQALAADHRDRRGLVFQPLPPALWRKGESSGHVQRVVEMRIDCDQDAVWIKVEQEGPAPAIPAGARASTARCRSARAAR